MKKVKYEYQKKLKQVSCLFLIFNSIVNSGTKAKKMKNEKDAFGGQLRDKIRPEITDRINLFNMKIKIDI